jgi:hypothetical protein
MNPTFNRKGREGTQRSGDRKTNNEYIDRKEDSLTREDEAPLGATTV